MQRIATAFGVETHEASCYEIAQIFLSSLLLELPDRAYCSAIEVRRKHREPLPPQRQRRSVACKASGGQRQYRANVPRGLIALQTFEAALFVR